MKVAIEHANARADALEQRTTSLEVATNSHSDTITELEQQVSQLRKEVVSLTAKTQDLEARSRRCNLRIFSIKERREDGTHPTTFVAQVLQNVPKLDKPSVLDRAHGTLQQVPDEGQQPRAFVIKCHYYQEKEAIPCKSLAAQNLISEYGNRIQIFLYYAQSVARQQAAFKQARTLRHIIPTKLLPLYAETATASRSKKQELLQLLPSILFHFIFFFNITDTSCYTVDNTNRAALMLCHTLMSGLTVSLIIIYLRILILSSKHRLVFYLV